MEFCDVFGLVETGGGHNWRREGYIGGVLCHGSLLLLLGLVRSWPGCLTGKGGIKLPFRAEFLITKLKNQEICHFFVAPVTMSDLLLP